MAIMRTGLPILVELIDLVNSVIIFLSQMTLLRWLTFLCRSQTVILIALLFLTYFILLMLVFVMTFPSLGISDHVFVSVFIGFLSNSQQDALLDCMVYDYSCADWDGLCDHVRDVPWEDVFKLVASAAASEFCEWVWLGIDVYIPQKIPGATSFISMVFSCLCCCHNS